MLKIKDGIDISAYNKVQLHMKQANIGYEAEKSMIFSKDDVRKFLVEADDEKYLLMKVE